MWCSHGPQRTNIAPSPVFWRDTKPHPNMYLQVRWINLKINIIWENTRLCSNVLFGFIIVVSLGDWTAELMRKYGFQLITLRISHVCIYLHWALLQYIGIAPVVLSSLLRSCHINKCGYLIAFLPLLSHMDENSENIIAIGSGIGITPAITIFLAVYQHSKTHQLGMFISLSL